MKWNERRYEFRRILSGSNCIFPASVHDPLTARIAEEIGFEVGMLAGSTAALSVLGAPDLCTISLGEFAEQALRINRACNLPLMVDGDHGYGNAYNVMRTIEELEIAGVCAITIEDTDLPMRFGNRDTLYIAPEEAIGKLQAALYARQDASLTVIARTTLDKHSTLDALMPRIVAYAATGVDAIFISGIQTIEQIKNISSAIDIPIILGATKLATFQNQELLSKYGVRLALQGHAPIKASVQAVYETLNSLRRGILPSELENLATDEMMQILTREEKYQTFGTSFLTPRLAAKNTN